MTPPGLPEGHHFGQHRDAPRGAPRGRHGSFWRRPPPPGATLEPGTEQQCRCVRPPLPRPWDAGGDRFRMGKPRGLLLIKTNFMGDVYAFLEDISAIGG